jgi:hypothetical protein
VGEFPLKPGHGEAEYLLFFDELVDVLPSPILRRDRHLNRKL